MMFRRRWLDTTASAGAALACLAIAATIAPLYLLLTGCSVAPRPANSTEDASETLVRGALGEELDDYLTRLEAFGFSGAVLVAQGERVVLSRGYGFVDTAQTAPITPETVFFSASIAKQFTAAAVMRLVEAGRLSLGDSLPRFFADVPADKRGITVHQLLTHSSGLTAYHTPFGPEAHALEPWVRSLLATPLGYPPGTSVEYSNAAFSLAAAVVERASGQPFEHYVREQLFRPAGLQHAGFASEGGRWPADQVAKGIGGGIKIDPLRFGSGWGEKGASGIMISAEDLWRWERALLGGNIVSATSLALMFNGYVPLAPGIPIEYGYGWRTQWIPRAGRVIWASGIDQPFSAMYRRYVDADATIIFLSNGARDALVWRDILFFGLREGPIGQIVLGDEYEMPPWFLAEPPAPLGRYAGAYVLPSGAVIEVHAEGDHLRLVPHAQDAAMLLLPMWPDSGEVPLDSLTSRAARTLGAPGTDPSTAIGPLVDEGQTYAVPDEVLGRFLGVDWLVTLPIQVAGATRRATTYGLLRFEGGTLPLRWRWWNGAPYGRDVGLGLGVLPPFRPQSAEHFVSYHASLQHVIGVMFELDERGRARALVIPSSSASTRAPRQLQPTR